MMIRNHGFGRAEVSKTHDKLTTDPARSLVQEGTGSVRFVSVPDKSKIHRFGSVRKVTFPGSTRFGLRFSDFNKLTTDNAARSFVHGSAPAKQVLGPTGT